MDKEDSDSEISGCVTSSAAAAREGDIRRRRRIRHPPGRDAAAEVAAETSKDTSASADTGVDVKLRGRQPVSSVGISRDDSEDDVQGRSTNQGSVTNDVGDANVDRIATDTELEGAAGRQPSNEASSEPSMQQPQPTGSRLLIEVTPQIRTFLETRVPQKKRAGLVLNDRIDLDVLQRLVRAANEQKGGRPKVSMADLVEGSHVVERIEPPQVSLDKLSFSERLRLMAEERRHQAAVRSLWGEPSDRQDSFADLNKSLAMGINALVGIFLTFLGGYWAAMYCGVDSFQTCVIIGLVCSICCMIVEVLLFVIHDERQRLRAKKQFAPQPIFKTP